MKTTYIIIALSLISLSLTGQSDEDFAALEEFLNTEKLQQLMENDFDRYQQLAVLNKAYYVNDFGGKDVSAFENALAVSSRYSSLPPLTEAAILDGSMNLLGYNFKMSRKEYIYYRISDSDNLLVIPPTNLSLQKAGLETY